MEEKAAEYEVYTRPFKVGSRQGYSGFHGFNKRSYHGDIVYVNRNTSARKYNLVFHASASNITADPKEFNANELSWYGIRELFNDNPRPKRVGRISIHTSEEESSSTLEKMLEDVLARHTGKELELKFISLSPKP